MKFEPRYTAVVDDGGVSWFKFRLHRNLKQDAPPSSTTAVYLASNFIASKFGPRCTAVVATAVYLASNFIASKFEPRCTAVVDDGGVSCFKFHCVEIWTKMHRRRRRRQCILLQISLRRNLDQDAPPSSMTAVYLASNFIASKFGPRCTAVVDDGGVSCFKFHCVEIWTKMHRRRRRRRCILLQISLRQNLDQDAPPSSTTAVYLASNFIASKFRPRCTTVVATVVHLT